MILATLLACDKEDEYQPKKIYTEYYVCSDTFIMHKAVYVTSNSAIVYVDSVKPYDFIFAKATSKVVFDRKNNLSAQYIGGYHDTCFVDNCPVDAIPLIEPDPRDTVIRVPIVFKRYINVSYAILKITNGNEVSVDTAYYYLSCDLKTRHFEIYEGKKSYSDVFSLCVNKNANAGDSYYKLDDYCKLPFSIQSHNAFMVDIYPYWKTPVDSTEIVYLIQ
jgi:hypothetical protein